MNKREQRKRSESTLRADSCGCATPVGEDANRCSPFKLSRYRRNGSNSMIHYNVWFSYKTGINERIELTKVRGFLDEMQRRDLINGFNLLKNRAADGKSRLEKYHAIIEFSDDEQFDSPFSEVRNAGINVGAHGSMIENVDSFTIEVFGEVKGVEQDT